MKSSLEPEAPMSAPAPNPLRASLERARKAAAERSLCQRLGGEVGVHQLVAYFFEEMDRRPEASNLAHLPLSFIQGHLTQSPSARMGKRSK
jgi:hypothetical protein